MSAISGSILLLFTNLTKSINLHLLPAYSLYAREKDEKSGCPLPLSDYIKDDGPRGQRIPEFPFWFGPTCMVCPLAPLTKTFTFWRQKSELIIICYLA